MHHEEACVSTHQNLTQHSQRFRFWREIVSVSLWLTAGWEKEKLWRWILICVYFYVFLSITFAKPAGNVCFPSIHFLSPLFHQYSLSTLWTPHIGIILKFWRRIKCGEEILKYWRRIELLKQKKVPLQLLSDAFRQKLPFDSQSDDEGFLFCFFKSD